jgi:hypothetical protein
VRDGNSPSASDNRSGPVDASVEKRSRKPLAAAELTRSAIAYHLAQRALRDLVSLVDLGQRMNLADQEELVLRIAQLNPGSPLEELRTMVVEILKEFLPVSGTSDRSGLDLKSLDIDDLIRSTMTDKSIAERIGLSPSAFSEAKPKALSQFVRVVPFYLDADKDRARIVRVTYELTPELSHAVERFITELNVRRPKKRQVAVPRTYAVPSVATWFDDAASSITKSEWELRWEKAAELASAEIAVLVAEQLIRAKTRFCGIGWGRQLAYLTAALEDRPELYDVLMRNQNELVPPIFFPLWGDPVITKPLASLGGGFSDINKITSSTISERLGKWFKSLERPFSLRLVPGVIPQEIRDEHVANFKSFRNSIDDYREIFLQGGGGKQPLIQRATAMLLALGGGGEPPWYLKHLFKSKAAGAWRHNPIYGDVGGVILWRRQLSKEATALKQRLNNRWSGVQEHHVARLARVAAHGRELGVVAIGTAPNRKDAVFELLAKGLSNVLILDEHLARAVIIEVNDPATMNDRLAEHRDAYCTLN